MILSAILSFCINKLIKVIVALNKNENFYSLEKNETCNNNNNNTCGHHTFLNFFTPPSGIF